MSRRPDFLRQAGMERLLALATLAAAGALLVVVAVNWSSLRSGSYLASDTGTHVDGERGGDLRAGPSTSDPPAADSTRLRPTGTVPDRIVARAEPEPHSSLPPAAPVRDTVELEITAARGDCWLEIYAGPASEEALFFNILAEGESIRFERTRFLVRTGAGEHVDVRINGEPVESFATGVSQVSISSEGIESVTPG